MHTLISEFTVYNSGACNSVVVVCLCVTYLFFVHFLKINKAVSFLVWIVLHCLFWAFYNWLCGMGFAHCWRPYGDLVVVVNFCVILVSCGELSHWQSYHIFFFFICSLLKAVRWALVVNVSVILVSCGKLSHWQSYHIFFFIKACWSSTI